MAFTPPSSATVNFDSLFTTTIANLKNQTVDNITRRSAFWARLNTKDRIEMYDGGTLWERAVEYALNGTVKSYEGYDPIDLTPQEHLTQARDNLREVAASVVISRREEVQNKGRAAIINLLSSKIENCFKSFNQKMNEMALAPTGSGLTAGNGGKDLNPLTSIITTSASTLHNINGSTYSWWDNQRSTSLSGASQDGACNYVEFKQEMRSAYNDCQKNNEGRPDLILTSQDVWEKYVEALENQVRYGSTEMANLGFESVMLGRAEVLWDEICPRQANGGGAYVLHDAGTADEHVAFFVNSDYLKLLVEATTNMVTTPFQRSLDQTARSALVLFMGQLVCTNRRTQGLLSDIDPTTITVNG